MNPPISQEHKIKCSQKKSWKIGRKLDVYEDSEQFRHILYFSRNIIQKQNWGITYLTVSDKSLIRCKEQKTRNRSDKILSQKSHEHTECPYYHTNNKGIKKKRYSEIKKCHTFPLKSRVNELSPCSQITRSMSSLPSPIPSPSSIVPLSSSRAVTSRTRSRYTVSRP